MAKKQKDSNNRKNSNSKDFNIYYLNFSKVYELSMMINNVIVSSIQKENTKSFEAQYGYSASAAARVSSDFLASIKTSLSTNAKDTSFSSSKVVENLDIKTTKSILLRRIIQKCHIFNSLKDISEGALIKIDNIKLSILDEESLRQFSILRKDALKGYRVEGMELNNLISSMLQDYAYVLKGRTKSSENENIIIKIPMEIQNEFENKYSIDDVLLGHVSIVGIYKEKIDDDYVLNNTLTYFQNVGIQAESQKKIIKSNRNIEKKQEKDNQNTEKSHYIDVIAIIQDVSFKLSEELPKKQCFLKRIINCIQKTSPEYE